jgi:putative chitinase
MITQNQLKAAIPLKNDIIAHMWFVPLADILDHYAINTNARIAAFLAQTSHESAAYTAFIENLNYSADALVKIFPSHFHGDAANYNRKPEAIANRIYASRMGNGDEASGDGWKFKGRGLIQLTGRANYTAFATDVTRSLEDVVQYLETQDGALESACWYWTKHNLNALADRGDNLGITKAINGGTIGFAERVALTTKILKIIA